MYVCTALTRDCHLGASLQLAALLTLVSGNDCPFECVRSQHLYVSLWQQVYIVQPGQALSQPGAWLGQVAGYVIIGLGVKHSRSIRVLGMHENQLEDVYWQICHLFPILTCILFAMPRHCWCFTLLNTLNVYYAIYLLRF